MFYNGIISSQEVFRIDSVRDRFHFSSAELRWERSLWCDPSQSSGGRRSETPRHAGRLRWAPRGPRHPTRASGSGSVVRGIRASRAAAAALPGRALPVSRGRTKKTPLLQKIPPFLQENPFFRGDLTFSRRTRLAP